VHIFYAPARVIGANAGVGVKVKTEIRLTKGMGKQAVLREFMIQKQNNNLLAM